MNRFLREPLVHFLAIGIGLFVLFGLVAPEESNLDSKTIVVDRDALLTFVQFRSKAFNPEVAAARLDALGDAELARLIDDYVREEALHREALALGMDQNDYVIKQRLIQSLQFITNGFVSAAVDVSDEEIAEYYEANREDYYVDPYATFTHVYFSNDRHGREALALGMDQNDYVIKQRLIQSLQFITNGFVSAAVDVSDEEIADYYEANRDDYYVDPYATFTHVYFSNDRHGREQARQLAETQLAELNDQNVPFSESTRHGERFLYNVNYVERTEDFIASHFGRAMAAAVFELEPDDSRWYGPFESAYGQHLVMLTKRTEGVYPPLEEIADSVREDALRIKLDEQNDRAVQAIVDTYDIRMGDVRGTGG